MHATQARLWQYEDTPLWSQCAPTIHPSEPKPQPPPTDHRCYCGRPLPRARRGDDYRCQCGITWEWR